MNKVFMTPFYAFWEIAGKIYLFQGHMKFLAIESLRISLKLNISAAREQQAVGLGLSINVVASWVMACEYLSLGLHVGNHSRPTPLTIIFYFC